MYNLHTYIYSNPSSSLSIFDEIFITLWSFAIDWVVMNVSKTVCHSLKYEIKWIHLDRVHGKSFGISKLLCQHWKSYVPQLYKTINIFMNMSFLTTSKLLSPCSYKNSFTYHYVARWYAIGHIKCDIFFQWLVDEILYSVIDMVPNAEFSTLPQAKALITFFLVNAQSENYFCELCENSIWINWDALNRNKTKTVIYFHLAPIQCPFLCQNNLIKHAHTFQSYINQLHEY